jgi:hypothetical protein
MQNSIRIKHDDDCETSLGGGMGQPCDVGVAGFLIYDIAQAGTVIKARAIYFQGSSFTIRQLHCY